MITEIQENFYRITLRMPYRLRHVNAYLCASDGELALFDTGLNTPGALEKFCQDLSGIGYHLNDIRRIYLTHVHTDHCSMAGLLQKISQARIYLSAATFEEYEHYRESAPMVKQVRAFYARHGMLPPQINRVIRAFESLGRSMSELHTEPYLQHHETNMFGDWKFEVLFTPGHSLGHVCFYFPREGFLFSGDHILPYIAPILSPDIFDEDFRPLKAYFDSFCDLETLPVSTVFPGHGSYFTDFKGRLTDIRNQHNKKTEMVLSHVSEKPQTAYEIAQKIAAPTASDLDHFLILNETIIYLQELRAGNAVQESLIDNFLYYTAVQGWRLTDHGS